MESISRPLYSSFCLQDSYRDDSRAGMPLIETGIGQSGW
jgi:hypothetical protein